MPLPPLDQRPHDDDEVRALPKTRQPQPFEQFSLAAPANGQGAGLSRKSPAGDRWCPFCQTPLGRQKQACMVCQPVRQQNVRRGNIEAPAPAPPSPVPDEHLQHLLKAIDELSRVIGMASARQNKNGGLKPEQTEEMFFACKDVMVATDPIRAALRRNSP